MRCSQCAAELHEAQKFCGGCGAPAPRIDPLASTVKNARTSSSPRTVSPLASSAFEFGEELRQLVADVPEPKEPGPRGTVLMAQRANEQPRQVVACSTKWAPGAAVRVRWADGRRYPGTVQHAEGALVLVVFADGQRHWVDVSYVEPG